MDRAAKQTVPGEAGCVREHISTLKHCHPLKGENPFRTPKAGDCPGSPAGHQPSLGSAAVTLPAKPFQQGRAPGAELLLVLQGRLSRLSAAMGALRVGLHLPKGYTAAT